MAKIALLIGISDYGEGLSSLPGTREDIQMVQRVLQNPQIGGFDQVEVLPNPDRNQMESAIEILFTENRSRDDLILLYFSGHGFRGDNGTLYFATCTTGKIQGRIRINTAIPSSTLQDYMSQSRSKRQVLILDCCFSGAFANDMKAKQVEEVVDIKAQLGGEGRAVLTSSTATQVSYEKEGASIYTRYLVQGLETGAADRNSNGQISVDELHEYAKEKVQEAAPTMQPEIYVVKEGYKIWIARAPQDDPKLVYRKELDERAKQKQGNLSLLDRQALKIRWQRDLGLSSQDAESIETEVLQPYQMFRAKLDEFEQAVQAVQAVQETPNQAPQIIAESLDDLQFFQRVLKLRDEDVAPILRRYSLSDILPSTQSAHQLASSSQENERPNPILAGIPRELLTKIVLGSVMVAALLGGVGLWSKYTSGLVIGKSSSSRPLLVPVENLISAGDNKDLSGNRRYSLDLGYREQQIKGIEEFKAKNYKNALGTFRAIRAADQGNNSSSPKKDPEILIFQNNSEARLNQQDDRGSPIYTIAAAVPLSDANGDSFNIGQQILFGVAQAQAKALEQGINLEVVIANDRNLPEQAQELAKELSNPYIKGFDNQQREILAVVGHYSSTVTCAALRFYNQAGLAIVSPVSSRTDLRSKCGGDKVFFRTTSSAALEAKALVDYLRNKSGITTPKVAIFYKKGEGFSQDLFKAFEGAFGDLTQISRFDLSNPSDMEKGKNQLSNFNVLAVFPDGRTSDDKAFREAKDVIIKDAGNSLILGSNPLYDSEIAKENKLRVLSSHPEKGLVLAIDWLSGCSGEDKEFVKDAATMWGGPPNRVSALSYEAVQVLVARLGEGQTTRTEILESLGNSKEDEVVSDVFQKKTTISFGPNGDRNETKNRILVTPYQYKDDQFGPVPGEQSCSP